MNTKQTIRRILKENSNKNKEKIMSLLEKLFNNEIKKVQNICQSAEDYENIPDDIAFDTCKDIDAIVQVRVTDVEEKNGILMIQIDTDIDSLFPYLDVTDILYDIKKRVSIIYGQHITLIEGEVNNIDNREW